jgi:hypothetical protein
VPQEDALALGQVVAAQCRYSGSNPCSTPWPPPSLPPLAGHYSILNFSFSASIHYYLPSSKSEHIRFSFRQTSTSIVRERCPVVQKPLV